MPINLKPILIQPNNYKAFLKGRRVAGLEHLPYFSRTTNNFLKNKPNNQKHLIKTMEKLHILARHSTPSIQKKYNLAYKAFLDHHIPFFSNRTTMTFIKSLPTNSFL